MVPLCQAVSHAYSNTGNIAPRNAYDLSPAILIGTADSIGQPGEMVPLSDPPSRF
jgi:hypothetical protein